MAAGGGADGEVDHLGGKDESAHYAEQREPGFFKLALRALDDIAGGGNRGDIERGPDWRGKKTVGDVHPKLASR